MTESNKELQKVESYRWNLIVVIVVNFLATGTALILLGISVQENPIFLVSLGVCVFLLSLYAIEREYRLHRLSGKLVDEEITSHEREVKQSLLNSEIKELSSLHPIVMQGRELDPKEVSGKILKVLVGLFRADRASVMLLDDASGRLMIAAADGVPQAIVENASVKMGEGVAGFVAKVGEPLILSGVRHPEEFINLENKTVDIQSAISAPLLAGNRVIGVINLSLIKGNRQSFVEGDLRLLQLFAQYAAVILDQARVSLRNERLT